MTNKVEEFCKLRQEIESVYDNFARMNGLSYTALYTLNAINNIEKCTQKKICAQSFMPKQTINSVVKVFVNKGWVELLPCKTDARERIICFTEKGKEEVLPLLMKIQEAESEAMSSFSEEDQIKLVSMLRAYDMIFKQKMLARDEEKD
nr:MarR family winged helix-turn-helix transcriptional regulator [Streptococcus lutetiensis]